MKHENLDSVTRTCKECWEKVKSGASLGFTGHSTLSKPTSQEETLPQRRRLAFLRMTPKVVLCLHIHMDTRSMHMFPHTQDKKGECEACPAGGSVLSLHGVSYVGSLCRVRGSLTAADTWVRGWARSGWLPGA